MKFSYDFWYQPRHNVMVSSSEWAAPNTFMPGFDLEEVGHLRYGREIHFWDFEKRKVGRNHGSIWEKTAWSRWKCASSTIPIQHPRVCRRSDCPRT